VSFGEVDHIGGVAKEPLYGQGGFSAGRVSVEQESDLAGRGQELSLLFRKATTEESDGGEAQLCEA
jgi:hypothetical protein